MKQLTFILFVLLIGCTQTEQTEQNQTDLIMKSGTGNRPAVIYYNKIQDYIPVGQAKATDPDKLKKWSILSYEIEWQPKDKLVWIDRQTGQLFVNKENLPKFITYKYYKMRVMVSDGEFSVIRDVVLRPTVKVKFINMPEIKDGNV